MKNKTLKLSFLVLFALFIISLTIGKYPISLSEIFFIITGVETKGITKNVFINLRLGRCLMGVIAGFALGFSGHIYQTLFKNPLSSPDIIGVSSGASLGAAFAIAFLGSGSLVICFGAFLGGILAVFFAIMLVNAWGKSRTSGYVISGIVISSLAKAVIMIIKYLADTEGELAAIEFWTMGSLGGVTLKKALAVLLPFLSAFILLVLLRRQILLLGLSDDEARSLGLGVKSTRALILALSTLMISSVISVTGLISFLGLISPHIARLINRENNFSAAILSGFTGAIILVASDIICRLFTTELPISIITTFAAVPVLVYFMFRSKEEGI